MLHYNLTDYQHKTSQVTYWDNAFSDDELNYLQNLARNPSSEVALVGGNRQDSDIRRSNVSWINNNSDNMWIFDRLSHVVSTMNASTYRYDLSGFGEPLQLTNYDSSDAGMYAWHQDFGSVVSRKLSLVLQLSDPVEYEGGTLEYLQSSFPEKVSKKRGLITLFPSFMLHQVTPVTQGNRQSLVCWLTGPQFK